MEERKEIEMDLSNHLDPFENEAYLKTSQLLQT